METSSLKISVEDHPIEKEWSDAVIQDIDSLFPEVESSPTLQVLKTSVLTGVEKETRAYKKGCWIEFWNGVDMIWHLGKVSRVTKVAPDSWDWSDPDNEGLEPDYELFYDIGRAFMLGENFVRAPSAGLKAIFGLRPWVFQQYSLLKLEEKLRFQHYHRDDFMQIDSQQFFLDMFDEWVKHNENADFESLYEICDPLVREQLRNHLATPFELMDRITEDDEIWDFEDEDISIYTYFSVFGSSSFFALITAGVQVGIPVLLLINSMQNSEHINVEYIDNTLSIHATWDQFCSSGDNGKMIGRLLIMSVVMMYIITVVPDNLTKFYRNAGSADTTYSRINSLRAVVWNQGDDTILQQMGFKCERYMNTAYVCLLYMIMLFILFNTVDVLDIILNALACEFVHQLDEKIAHSDWWDSDLRYIQAGTQQLVLQAFVRLRVIESPRNFCKYFHIDPKDYESALGSRTASLRDKRVARRDESDQQWMTEAEASERERGEYARHIGNDSAEEYYKKLPHYYGVKEWVMGKFGVNSVAMFERTREFRTWSRWNAVLYLSKLPNHPEFDPSAIKVSKSKTDYSVSVLDFFLEIVQVLTFYKLFVNVYRALKLHQYARALFLLFDSVLNWIAYLMQVIFPIFIITGLWFIPFCF